MITGFDISTVYTIALDPGRDWQGGNRWQVTHLRKQVQNPVTHGMAGTLTYQAIGLHADGLSLTERAKRHAAGTSSERHLRLPQ